MLQDELLSYTVRGCAYEVYREQGAGCLEKVYERAPVKELRDAGLGAEAQVPVAVRYKGELVGEYFADILVEGRQVLELKAQSQVPPGAEGQLLNYLCATGMRVGLLVNLAGPRAGMRRLVL